MLLPGRSGSAVRQTRRRPRPARTESACARQCRPLSVRFSFHRTCPQRIAKKPSPAFASPEAERLLAAAKRNKIFVALGLSERDGGSLYIAQWIIGPGGE